MIKFKLLFGENNIKTGLNILGTLLIIVGICFLPFNPAYRAIIMGAFVVLLSYVFTTK